ncbi:MAG: iron ABC transporter permease [Proteobacteria bacterium]|nr:iron ABC transporter permease [Pseudomonadota bacterium]
MKALTYLLCSIFLMPFVALAFVALSSPDVSQWMFHVVELKSVLWSLVSGLAAGLVTAMLGAILAYVVCFHRFPLRRILGKFLVLPLLFPTFILGAIYKELFAVSGMLTKVAHLPTSLTFDFESASGFIFIMSIGLFPYVYLLSRISFESHGRAFFELGQTVGLSFARSFIKILLPLTLPAVLLGAGLVFVETAGEWATASLLSVNTGGLTLHELWFLRGAPNLASQLAFFFIIVALIALIPITRWVGTKRTGYLAGVPANSPSTSREDRSGYLKWVYFGVCFMPFLLGFLIPLAAMVIFFIQTVDTVDLSMLLANSVNTVALLFTVLIICTAFALLLGATHRSSSGVITGMAVRWLTISYTMPATVLAVGVLILADRGLPLGERYSDVSSFFILALALSIRFVCFLVIPIYIGLSFMSRRIEETGASLGLSKKQVFFRLHLPQIRGFAMLGLLLLTLQVLKETAISVALHPFSFQTLVLKAYAYIDIDMLSESSAWILAMVLLGLYPLLTIEGILSKRRVVGS